MFNLVTRPAFGFIRGKTDRAATWMVFIRDTASGFLTTIRHAFRGFGVIAIAVLGLLFVKPDLADELKELSPFAEAEAAMPDQQISEAATLLALQTPASARAATDVTTTKVSAASATPVATARQQERVTSWLSRRYRVASDATNLLVSAAYQTAQEIKIDPLLILSVVAIESGFNPFAESPVGAQGLMQVMSKIHHDKFQRLGGVKAALNPVANIRVGSLILKDYVTRGGSVEAGLKLYVGAGNLNTDFGYGAKVLAEYQRLKAVSMGKKVSIYATTPLPKARPQPAKIEASRDAAPAGEPSKPTKASAQLASL